MPYTPPAAQSPVASKTHTPTLSRSHSYTKTQQHVVIPAYGDSRGSLPHSSSYLNKHRRSPSISKSTSTFTANLPTPDTTPEDSGDPEIDHGRSTLSRSGTPQSSHDGGSSNLSPPASPQTSSDEETTSKPRGRVRNLTNLAELQAAIRIIEQHRAGSPDGLASEDTRKARVALGLPGPRLDFSFKETNQKSELPAGLPLSAAARKITHSRSTTDASAFFDFPRNKFDSPLDTPVDNELDDDDEEEDEDLAMKPALIRKKSGELVRPALRASSLKRRPSSMPGTPTYSKAVHFQDNSLEHVRHFLQVDRPIAVSAGSSPVESVEDENEFPFGSQDVRSPPFDWEIRLTNFHPDSSLRTTLPVRMEKVYLSTDTKILIGAVAARNLAFHKLVVARFTLDYWKTTSEVIADYSNDVRRTQQNDGYDRFTFSIRLEDQANLENKTMFFCIRYNVNGQEYWDNNNSINYQVDFSKKYKLQNGKQGTQAATSRPLGVLPRSKPSSATGPRPRSMPSFDDFSGMVSPYEFSSFPQPSAVIGDSPIRFKNKAPLSAVIPDAPGRPQHSTNKQAFGNRYDFGASLSAAMQGAATRDASKPVAHSQSTPQQREHGAAPAIQIQPSPHAGDAEKSNEMGQPPQAEPLKPTALTEKASLHSSSYHDLLDKYCFFGSAKPSPTLAKSASAQVDGAGDRSPGSGIQASHQTSSSSPSAPKIRSPPPSEKQASSIITSPRDSQSSSPRIGSPIGSRTSSPASFGYPYHQPLQSTLFEQHTPTAIRG